MALVLVTAACSDTQDASSEMGRDNSTGQVGSQEGVGGQAAANAETYSNETAPPQTPTPSTASKPESTLSCEEWGAKILATAERYGQSQVDAVIQGARSDGCAIDDVTSAVEAAGTTDVLDSIRKNAEQETEELLAEIEEDLRGWAPTGFTARDDNFAFKWAKNPDCSPGIRCSTLIVVTQRGCSNGLYVEALVLNGSGTVINWVNESLPYLPAQRRARLTFEAFADDAEYFELASFNCSE